MGIQIFSLIVLLVLGASIVALLVFLAMWPGLTAKSRNHPYADAVNIAGWVGMLAGGVLWPMALIWAYATRSDANPVVQPPSDSDNAQGDSTL